MFVFPHPLETTSMAILTSCFQGLLGGISPGGCTQEALVCLIDTRGDRLMPPTGQEQMRLGMFMIGNLWTISQMVIQFKSHGKFILIQVVMEWSLWNLAHGTTALLSWLVLKKFNTDMITFNGITRKPIFIKFQLRWEKNISWWKGPQWPCP